MKVRKEDVGNVFFIYEGKRYRFKGEPIPGICEVSRCIDGDYDVVFGLRGIILVYCRNCSQFWNGECRAYCFPHSAEEALYRVVGKPLCEVKNLRSVLLSRMGWQEPGKEKHEQGSH